MFEEPEERVRRTRHARPRLASQAPNVKMIKIRNACVNDRKYDEMVMKKERDRIMASKDKRAIRI